MAWDTDKIIREVLTSLENTDQIEADEIPDIELYMDQVTTFMEQHLSNSKRYPQDKILTKTMINNYAKNRLLPPPEKKKYSKEHILVLLYIYYFKNVLSIGDIQKLLNPLTEKYFQSEGSVNMEKIYAQVYKTNKNMLQGIINEIMEEYEKSGEQYKEAKEDDQGFLRVFLLICSLSYDVYIKKQTIEKLIDALPVQEKKKKREKPEKGE